MVIMDEMSQVDKCFSSHFDLQFNLPSVTVFCKMVMKIQSYQICIHEYIHFWCVARHWF